jgi:hypothetical protein
MRSHSHRDFGFYSSSYRSNSDNLKEGVCRVKGVGDFAPGTGVDLPGASEAVSLAPIADAMPTRRLTTAQHARTLPSTDAAQNLGPCSTNAHERLRSMTIAV